MSYIEQKIRDVLRAHQRHGAFNCRCGERIAADGAESYPTLPEHQAATAVKELGLVQFYAVAYGDGGQSEECYEHWDQARDMAAEATSAGYPDVSIVTAWFTGWEPAENIEHLT
jgi:hypothetical protein